MERKDLQLQVRIEIPAVQTPHQAPVLKLQDHLDHPGDPGGQPGLILELVDDAGVKLELLLEQRRALGGGGFRRVLGASKRALGGIDASRKVPRGARARPCRQRSFLRGSTAARRAVSLILDTGALVADLSAA